MVLSTSLASNLSLDISRTKSFSPYPMENSSVFYGNVTSSPGKKNLEIIKTGLVVLTALCFCIFLYFVAIILSTYCNTTTIRENARYVLFAHMLVNDTLYLLVGFALVIANMYTYYIPGPVCIVVYTLASATFRITPYNLAVMSLERYAAICFPLQHVSFCTVQKANIAVVIMWVLGFIPNIVEFVTIGPSIQNLFSVSVVCNQEVLLRSPWQAMIRSLTLLLSFALVGIIILYTYVKVTVVARQITSSKSSAQKAGKTVMLHAFQLLLCMAALITTHKETYPNNFIDFSPLTKFFLLSCLPRFLSPIIYGIRDKVLSKRMKKLYPTRI
ncbi:odorant receptor 131-2-like [Pelodytes ibericus]